MEKLAKPSTLDPDGEQEEPPQVELLFTCKNTEHLYVQE